MNLSLSETERLLHLVRIHDWQGVEGFAVLMQKRMGEGLYKKFALAVERIEIYFQKHTLAPAWPRDWPPEKIQEHQLKLCWFVRNFKSVAPLLRDINLAFDCSLTPHSLAYFMVTDKGRKTSRWELLLAAKREAEWALLKEEENQWAHELDKQTHSRTAAQPHNLDPATRLWLHAARAEYQSLLKAGDVARALLLANKALNLAGVDVTNSNPHSPIIPHSHEGGNSS